MSSWSNTENFWITNGWFTILDAETDDLALGQAIREALSRTEPGIPTPSRAELSKKSPVLKALGLRSENAYMEGTGSVDVLGKNGAPNLEVTPHENEGRSGFISIADAREQVPRDVPPEQLAAAVRRALARCA